LPVIRPVPAPAQTRAEREPELAKAPVPATPWYTRVPSTEGLVAALAVTTLTAAASLSMVAQKPLEAGIELAAGLFIAGFAAAREFKLFRTPASASLSRR
jgi:hypothetical protein